LAKRKIIFCDSLGDRYAMVNYTFFGNITNALEKSKTFLLTGRLKNQSFGIIISVLLKNS
jgi:hypothetical protein